MKGDLIDVVEAAYRVQPTTKLWLTEAARACRLVLDEGMGGFMISANISDQQRVSIDEFVLAGATTDFRDFVEGTTPLLSPTDQSVTYRSPVVFGTMAERIGATTFKGHWLRDEFRKRGVVDFAALMAFDPSGSGCAFAFARSKPTKTTRRQREAWKRVAAHLTAGLRLQRASSTMAALEHGADAVLTTGGKVLHAEPAAQPSIELLREAAVRIDRARVSSKRTDADEALELWRGLVEGKWSLVDIFDRDGKRFVVARENAPSPSPIPSLSVRERQVLAYVAMGYSNKLVAYHLGLAPSTTAEHLGRAMLKIGLRSRLDIARVFGAGLSKEGSGSDE